MRFGADFPFPLGARKLYGRLQRDARGSNRRIAALLEVPEVAILARTIGDFDLMAVVAATVHGALVSTVLERIAPLDGVRHTETYESARTFKHAYTWARLV